MTNSFIAGCGSYLPEKKVKNSDLAKIIDTSDEWIKTRTGIELRNIAAEDELTSDMAKKAAEEAISDSNIDKNSIDLIIVATTTPDLTFPSTASILQRKLGIENVAAFDIQAVCSGFIYALNTADNFIKTKQAKTVLVVGAEKMSTIINWQDRKTCILFGDGAGAVVLKSTDNPEQGILGNIINTNGALTSYLCTDGGVGSSGSPGQITMNESNEIFRLAIEKMTDVTKKILAKYNYKTEDVDVIIPHQANLRITNVLSKKLNIGHEKIISTIDYHANTSAASIPLAINEAKKTNKLKKNDLVVLTAFGSGITWGASLLRWN